MVAKVTTNFYNEGNIITINFSKKNRIFLVYSSKEIVNNILFILKAPELLN